MAWPEFEIYERLMARREPGPGAGMPDQQDSGKPPKMRSIPNLSTARLLRSRLFMHDQLHTTAGLSAHDDTRRSLVNAGLKLKAINHELTLRGHRADNGCRHCMEGREDLTDEQRTDQ